MIVIPFPLYILHGGSSDGTYLDWTTCVKTGSFRATRSLISVYARHSGEGAVFPGFSIVASGFTETNGPMLRAIRQGA